MSNTLLQIPVFQMSDIVQQSLHNSSATLLTMTPTCYLALNPFKYWQTKTVHWIQHRVDTS